MKDTGVIFQGWGVRAILEDRKTMTRRMTGKGLKFINRNPSQWIWDAASTLFVRKDSRLGKIVTCPYGVPGDRLWVRETWGAPDADHPRCKDGRKPQPGDRIVYRANPADDYQWGPGRPSQGSFCWRPSIFMFRWVSRIDLNVVAVRVERVQDISEEDAKAEGCDMAADDLEDAAFESSYPSDGYFTPSSYVSGFRALWDSINAKPKPIMVDGKIHHYVSYPWEEARALHPRETREHRGRPWYVCGNPWVFVVEFKRVK